MIALLTLFTITLASYPYHSVGCSSCIGQSANGAYRACRETNFARIVILNSEGKEISAFPDSAMTACYVADDGLALLKINQYRYSPIYLSLWTKSTNVTLSTDTLLRLINVDAGTLIPPSKPNKLPYVVMGGRSNTYSAALYFPESDKVIIIGSAGDVQSKAWEASGLARDFLSLGSQLLARTNASQHLEIDFETKRLLPPLFWTIQDTLSFVFRHRELSTNSGSSKMIWNPAFISVEMRSTRARESISIGFPVARRLGASGGRSAHITVNAGERNDYIAIRLYDEQTQLGVVLLRSVPAGEQFSIDCDWIPSFVDHFVVETIPLGGASIGSNVVIRLPAMRNSLSVAF